VPTSVSPAASRSRMVGRTTTDTTRQRSLACAADR
jgi:hypothetical protein